MYTLFTDKSEILEAVIKAEGVSKKNIKCRVILEASPWSLIIPGNISTNGDCEVKIDALGSVLSEGDEGKIILEVVADDTLFTIWDDTFKIQRSKSIQLESISVQDAVKKPSITATVKSNTKMLSESKKLCNILINENITSGNLSRKRSATARIFHQFFEKHPRISQPVRNQIISESLWLLSSLQT